MQKDGACRVITVKNNKSIITSNFFIFTFNSKYYWLTIIFLVLILLRNCTGQAENIENISLWQQSMKADLSVFPDRLWEDSKDTFSRTDNMIALLLAGGASVVMHHDDTDNRVAEYFERHQVFSNFWDSSLDIIGSPASHFPITFLWYAMSADKQDEFNKERAWTMMTALTVNGVVTLGLKLIRNNDTPNGEWLGWPSGHTSSSFTVASVLHEFYGLKVGIPAYIVASLVGYRMMDSGDHWASDVVFGATLGWVVGHTIANKHKKLEVAGFKILPYTTTGNYPVMGVCLAKRF